LICMCFHGVSRREPHEAWARRQNGKVRSYKGYNYLINEEIKMAQRQPKKVGEYDRPTPTSRALPITIGIIVLIIVILLAIYFL